MRVGEMILLSLIEVLDDIQHGGTILPRSVHELSEEQERKWKELAAKERERMV